MAESFVGESDDETDEHDDDEEGGRAATTHIREDYEDNYEDKNGRVLMEAMIANLKADTYPRKHFVDEDIEEAWYCSGTQRRYKKMLVAKGIWRNNRSKEETIRKRLLKTISKMKRLRRRQESWQGGPGGGDKNNDRGDGKVGDDEGDIDGEDRNEEEDSDEEGVSDEEWNVRDGDSQDGDKLSEDLERHLTALHQWVLKSPEVYADTLGPEDVPSRLCNGCAQSHLKSQLDLKITPKRRLDEKRCASASQILGEALLACVEGGDLASVPMLIEYGASTVEQVVDFYGYSEGFLTSTTAIHAAVSVNDEIVLERLLDEFGGDVDVEEQPEQNTPLMESARTPLKIHLLKALLKRGAKPNIGDRNGFTPLHLAILQMFPPYEFLSREEFDGYLEMVRVLLDAGARTDGEPCFAQFGAVDRHILHPIVDAVQRLYEDDDDDGDGERDCASSADAETPTKSIHLEMIKKILSTLAMSGLDLDAWADFPDWHRTLLCVCCSATTFAPELITFLLNHGARAKMMLHSTCTGPGRINPPCDCVEECVCIRILNEFYDKQSSRQPYHEAAALKRLDELNALFDVLAGFAVNNFHEYRFGDGDLRLPVRQSRWSACELEVFAYYERCLFARVYGIKLEKGNFDEGGEDGSNSRRWSNRRQLADDWSTSVNILGIQNASAGEVGDGWSPLVTRRFIELVERLKKADGEPASLKLWCRFSIRTRIDVVRRLRRTNSIRASGGDEGEAAAAASPRYSRPDATMLTEDEASTLDLPRTLKGFLQFEGS